jgi:hypothetical protein
MKGKTMFLKMYYKLPEEARKKLVYDFTGNPMTLNVVAMEIRHSTNLGKKILKKLGYNDE